MRLSFLQFVTRVSICCALLAVAGGAVSAASYGSPAAPTKAPFTVEGVYVEACSCLPPCSCELTGDVEMGCIGGGALMLSGGRFQGVDLSGARLAYATLPGSWVRLYVETRSPQQRAALVALGRAAFAAFGPIESVTDAKIVNEGSGGKYTLTVNDGRIMKLVTEPVLGGDGKSPLAHSNTHNTFTKTFLQGRVVSGSYSDGNRSFTLEGSNAYFNDKLKTSGEL